MPLGKILSFSCYPYYSSTTKAPPFYKVTLGVGVRASVGVGAGGGERGILWELWGHFSVLELYNDNDGHKKTVHGAV